MLRYPATDIIAYKASYYCTNTRTDSVASRGTNTSASNGFNSRGYKRPTCRSYGAAHCPSGPSTDIATNTSANRCTSRI
ncbi:hypothetical protein [Collimonas arenae]|uniref:hypothetical protein n=1 Tax=Collimonas arenae TaxID=279058 RepID=UPI000FE13F8E|nr:hypothetical protein [Collimonas arenae]